MPLVTLDSVSLAFGHLPLLDTVDLQVEPRERIAVIGRNGTGKSTLLRILSREQAPDSGTAWFQPGLRLARLDQDVTLHGERHVFDTVAEGLGGLSDLVTAYHQATVEVARSGSAESLERLGRLQHDLERRDGWRIEQRVETVLARLRLAADVPVESLSGGWRRRVLLARALVGAPDLLLLDEPTNHLDVEAISWLEEFLAEYDGALVFITHDRAFLDRLATRVIELDRGRLTSWSGNYAAFVQKKDEWLANESIQQEKFDKRLAEEEVWLRQGVKARRTRNEGRVRALMEMRQARAARRTGPGVARLAIDLADRPGHIVIEAENVSVGFGGPLVIRDFSTRIVRGDRVGLIGPNGAGKTTLIRVLLGELTPTTGEVHRGTGVQVAYYDQQREQLDPDRSVFDTVGDGADTVTVNGEPRHVIGYLGDFLFEPERSRSPVRALSGGERNRLLLARLFTRPANLLVLDEPTNDLDLETLEVLEATLVAFSGTVLLVSHDRVFLDRVVTSTLAFEGEGRVHEYVGGYEDWLRQRRPDVAVSPQPEGERARADPLPVRPAAVRLSYNDKREFERLPARIETLEAEHRRLEGRVAQSDFYKESASAIAETLGRLEVLQRELQALYARWDDLDSRST